MPNVCPRTDPPGADPEAVHAALQCGGQRPRVHSGAGAQHHRRGPPTPVCLRVVTVNRALPLGRTCHMDDLMHAQPAGRSSTCSCCCPRGLPVAALLDMGEPLSSMCCEHVKRPSVCHHPLRASPPVFDHTFFHLLKQLSCNLTNVTRGCFQAFCPTALHVIWSPCVKAAIADQAMIHM